MLWASLGRKIIHLSGKYPRLGYLASAILIENIKNALDSEFSIILNQV